MTRDHRWHRSSTAAILFVAFLAATAGAQVVKVLPVDIAKGLQEGGMTVTIDPAYTGDTLKAFDGNNFTAYELTSTDTLRVTLFSPTPINVQKAKIYLWSGSSWTLEAADTITDLDAKTGSYTKLVNNKSAGGFAADSVTFTPKTAKVFRLRIKANSGTSVYLGEWSLEGAVTFTRLAIVPSPVRIVPGASLQLQVKLVDDHGRVFNYLLPDVLLWMSTQSTIVTVDETGKATGMALGAASIVVTNSAHTISDTAAVSVLVEFRSTKVSPMTIKVSLLIEDPAIVSQAYKKIHEIFGWKNPVTLANRLVELFKEATDSVVNFQIVETINGSRLFTHYYDAYLTPNQYYQLLSEPGWPSLKTASDSGKLWFDYREAVKYYTYDTRRNSGEIDEVWVFAGPYLAMYESQLMGPTAFWWNSPPIKDGTALTKLLSVMGLNYERGVDQAYHSFGHRMESAMVEAYTEVQGKPWNPKSTTPTSWDLFTRIEKDMPGQAHCGNVHFPPNGTSDYNYGNTTLVKSYAQNWFRYPTLFDQNAMVNLSTWIYSSEQYPSGDPLAEGQDHLGFMRWWYNHIPRYVGITDGILNNWWNYWLDYDAAMALAKTTGVLGPDDHAVGAPRSFELRQNFPNPFNPSTTIQFTLHEPGHVRLAVYDVLGREIRVLVDECLEQGLHAVRWDAVRVAAGVYFSRLESGSGMQVKKMVVLK